MSPHWPNRRLRAWGVTTMQTVKATGQLRHRFHGDYSAIIGLAFETPEAARDALATLGSDWSPVSSTPVALYAILSSDEVKAFEERFAPEVPTCTHSSCKRRKKADRLHDIGSISHSIDFGPRFTVTIPVVAAEQMGLSL